MLVIVATAAAVAAAKPFNSNNNKKRAIKFPKKRVFLFAWHTHIALVEHYRAVAIDTRSFSALYGV